jgi:hypothetical protein
MMCPAIENPTSSKSQTLIYFLHAKNLSAAEIRFELCVFYSLNVMSEGAVRQWYRKFKGGWTNVHSEDVNSHL